LREANPFPLYRDPWRGGIGKLTAAEAEPHVQRVIEPYLHIVAPLLEKSPKQYGGSPWIAKTLLRRQDRMLLCELHPRAFAALRANVGYDARIKLFQVDSYARLKAFLPPVERRGLVLIDPPFEAAEEFTKATDAIETAWRKWATGMLMLWYPIKNTRTCTSFATNLAERGVKRILRLELQIGPPIPQGSLARCGLLIVNPPFRLDADAKILLPWLATVLGSGKPGFLIEWLGGE
jgi:23S rRNA (adenine2030-N6)-methyltransferase